MGIEDSASLVKSGACVVCAGGHAGSDALVAEFQAFVETKLVPFRYPRVVRFFDALPTNDRGKLARHEVRALLDS